MSYQIRFISGSAHSADFNMAADSYLIDKCIGEDILYLRIYSWKRPSITIGRLQKAHEVLDTNAVSSNGVDWIRRPTGGRAVLHDEDLTYSCVFSQKITSLGTSIKETYSLISQCLKNGLTLAGIISETNDSDTLFNELKREQKLPCFLAPNRDEILVEGKKLVGSAQRRTAYSVLQHGSIPIGSAYLRLPEYLNISKEERIIQTKLLSQKTVHIRAIQSTCTYAFLSKCIVMGFKNTLGVSLSEMQWSSQDVSKIIQIQSSEKFRTEYCI